MKIRSRLNQPQFPLFIPECFFQKFEPVTQFLSPEFTQPVPLCDSRSHIIFSQGEKKEGSYSVKNYHSDVVVRASRTSQRADGLFLSAHCSKWETAFEGNKYLAICTADCLPVAFYYKSSDYFIGALAHAGWRGFASGVLQNTLSLLVEEAGLCGLERNSFLKDLHVFVAPAIFGVTYECGSDVGAALASHKRQIQAAHGTVQGYSQLYDFCCDIRQDKTLSSQIDLHLQSRGLEHRGDSIFPDLQLLCALECVMSEVRPENIELLRENTYGHPFFYSFRESIHGGTPSGLRQWTHLRLPH